MRLELRCRLGEEFGRQPTVEHAMGMGRDHKFLAAALAGLFRQRNCGPGTGTSGNGAVAPRRPTSTTGHACRVGIIRGTSGATKIPGRLSPRRFASTPLSAVLAERGVGPRTGLEQLPIGLTRGVDNGIKVLAPSSDERYGLTRRSSRSDRPDRPGVTRH